MRNKLLLLLPFIILSALSLGYISDDEPLKKLLSKLERLREEYPQEKVHLHLDKPYYTIGDTIWFKAYVVHGERNRLSALSEILYVELINEKDSIKKSLRLPVTSGLSWGDFTLSDSLREGNYRIRAYTNWMRNYGEEYFFDKSIIIGNSLTNNMITKTSYQFSKTGNSEKVEATVVFTDLNGKPFAKKEVTYDVQLNFRHITKGKAVTDDQGKVKINFVNNQPFVLKSGKINANIKVDENSVVSKSFPIKATSSAVDVQFFPESGQLVNGIRSKVGFKAVGADGLGVDISGYVINKKNEKLATFESEYAGMGSFTLTPEAGVDYTAVIKLNDGSEKRVELPKVAKEGYVLTVVNPADTSKLNIRVFASSGLIDGEEITVLAQSNNVTQYVSKAKVTSSVFNGIIPMNRLRSGIVQLTVFSSKYQPVAERLAFVNKNDKLGITMATDKQSYSPREKVTMSLDIKNPDGKPSKGSFSIAVTDMNKIPSNDDKESTIMSNLLLTSDLSGYIETPNYYFTNVNEDKLRQLDNLMLTQGWRKFSWKNLLAEQYPSILFAPEKSIEISGRVTAPNGKPIVGGKVSLLSTSGDGFALDTLTDSSGNFRFDNLTFTSTTNFVVQAYNARGRKNVDIDIYQVPPQMVTPTKNVADFQVDVNSSIVTYLKNSQEKFDVIKKLGLGKRNIILAEVKVVEKKPAVKHSSNLNGAGNADQVMKTEDFTNCISLIQCLEGRLVGVLFRNGVPVSTRGGVMNVMVDGIFTSPDYLSIIHPNDVESIEVLRNAGYLSIYGLRAGNGIIMINTKRGERNLSSGRYARGIASFSPQGYYIGREFYSPKYGTDDKKSRTMADLRTTIYWKPDIITDSTGKANIEFYSASTPTTYKAVVEGLDVSGKLGRQTFEIQVR